MAIYHCSVKPISRRSGRSSVAAAAYRSGSRLVNERDGQTHDYLARSGVVHSEIIVAKGSGADWARDRSALWNAVEKVETRKDSRVAREFEIALPHELDEDQRLELTRAFAQRLADRFGTAVDFAVHKPDPFGSEKNHHAHLMMTTRTVNAEGFGEKTTLELANKELLPRNLPTTQMQIKDVRRAWETFANDALERAGLNVRIDHRSHRDRGLEIEPTMHVGVHASALQRKGIESERRRTDAQSAERNADAVRQNPAQILEVVANERSVFTRQDIARALHRYLNDDVERFQSAMAQVMASPGLVHLRGDDPEKEHFTTAGVLKIERDMMKSAERLSKAMSHTVDRSHVARAIARQDAKLRGGRLSDEQRRAIEMITGSTRIASVVGVAGAGKSTMLAAAREAWEAQGYRVHGAALAGKATDGLRASAGINSRTLASWEHRWALGRDEIKSGDVFVIDEAGMIGSRQLARFVQQVEERGAKIVLVGDHEQLQAIGAGAAFRAITERTGFASLTEVRRQRQDWQRAATLDFAQGRTTKALSAYRQQGGVQMLDTRDDARQAIVADYVADRMARPDGSRIVLAHQRTDVRELNTAIRDRLQERGELARGEDAGEVEFQTVDGKRSFAAGDRIVFLENNADLGVQNGNLGTVERVEAGRIVAKLDGGERVEITTGEYQAFDHGYATTIHKSQGDTVDRAFVLASATMDRHMTYVAMSRHRDGVKLYGEREDFGDRQAGRLVAHGRAPFQHEAGSRESYFVTLRDDLGQLRTAWGNDLERAMAEARPEIGATIRLDKTAQEDGKSNLWEVVDSERIAVEAMERQLSRDGSKEITLDYNVISPAERSPDVDRAVSEGPQPEVQAEAPVAGPSKRERYLAARNALAKPNRESRQAVDRVEPASAGDSKRERYLSARAESGRQTPLKDRGAPVGDETFDRAAAYKEVQEKLEREKHEEREERSDNKRFDRGWEP